MPIGIERLNSPRPQPSSQIVFIKTLPGPDTEYAKDFLERIAAICHPIMKANHLSIMTLEEHEANTEFVGRNFNAGEIIQLVLKSYRTGQWLSFRTVQMVMMHELAHCMQMNHSRAFWKVRNDYAGELKILWQKGYTGDGLWGLGQTLLSGNYDTGRRPESDMLPEHLCGGAYRSSRRRKRKRGSAQTDKKPESYAEKQQRRVARKFGVSGQSLGGDQETRVKLEKGQVIKANPKVANSSRGRELRVAAALARFGQQAKDGKEKVSSDTKPDGKKEDSLSSTDGDSDGSESGSGNEHKIQNHEDHDMIKVCGSEDQDDVHVKQEMDELRDLNGFGDNISSELQGENSSENGTPSSHTHTEDHTEPATSNAPTETKSPPTQSPEGTYCPICSMVNTADAALCLACSHVLNTSLITNNWRCKSDTCKDGEYVNASDFGRCGVCGTPKLGNVAG